MQKLRFCLAGLIASASLLGIISSAEATTLYMKGDVVYRERMALPPKAKVEVTLSDVSAADASATVIAVTEIKPKGGVPIPYELKFDSAAIKPEGRYALRARITVDGKLLFTNTQNQAVFAGQDNDTQIFVQRTSDSDSSKSLEGLVGDWHIIQVDGKKMQATPSLTIGADGRVSGASGCNRFGGNLTLDGDKLIASQMMATQMACSEALMQQEQAIFQALSRVKTFKKDNKKIVFQDKRGKTIIVLSRI